MNELNIITLIIHDLIDWQYSVALCALIDAEAVSFHPLLSDKKSSLAQKSGMHVQLASAGGCHGESFARSAAVCAAASPGLLGAAEYLHHHRLNAVLQPVVPAQRPARGRQDAADMHQDHRQQRQLRHRRRHSRRVLRSQ